MPKFSVKDINISVDDFISKCDDDDINEIIKKLIEDDYLPRSVIRYAGLPGTNATEDSFEEHLNAIHGKWNMLSMSEEDVIMTIGKKFKY